LALLNIYIDRYSSTVVPLSILNSNARCDPPTSPRYRPGEPGRCRPRRRALLTTPPCPQKKNKQVRSILTLFSLFAIIGTLYFLREFWLARARAGALAHARATYPDRVRAFERGDEIPILVPVYGRPEYLSKVLEALIHAKDVSKSTVIFVSQDGSNPETT
jgi:hypothetical protein